ncbi:MAG: GTP-sensing pleiotropic transcriptional regulator CodY [Lachnospiraceae bacterium]|nr:GTP-sensing pleiotropic transcriptional regulator CodY [Lachnospiraceae bacterium]
MSVQLLDRIRKVNKLLHNNNGSVFIFNDVCEALSDAMRSNVLVISKKGKILGKGAIRELADDAAWQNAAVGKLIDKALNERLLNILSTQENVHLETLGFDSEANRLYRVIVTPIDIAGERLGTFFIYRKEESYGVDDIILAEYGTAVIGLEMLRSLNEESAEELRRRQVVRSAISTLSASEYEAVCYILEELDGREGILVASKVADRVGITRSVIVNALRKLESAGVIESRSSGMKGTYIKIVNDLILAEINHSDRDES